MAKLFGRKNNCTTPPLPPPLTEEILCSWRDHKRKLYADGGSRDEFAIVLRIYECAFEKFEKFLTSLVSSLSLSLLARRFDA